jgi:adenylate cyclase
LPHFNPLSSVRPGTRRQIRIFRNILGIAGLAGAAFGGAVGATVLEPPLLGGALAALSGAIDAMTLTAVIGGTEIFLPRTRIGRALESAPFLATFAFKSLFYCLVILAVVGGRFGTRISGMLIGDQLAQVFRSQIKVGLPRGLLVSIAVLVVPLLNLLRQASKVIGERTFRDIALGRFHRARTEERFFLFVDIIGSTPLAEKLGPGAVHDYLNRVFQIASEPIDEHGGDVYQYVGDEIVITWTLTEGRRAAHPIACYFAIEDAIQSASKDFEREFDTVPRLRAALHAGQVITGEVGGSRRAIVFHGDVMNTTSRIENATRDLQRPFLASEDALNRIEGRQAYKLTDLGPQQLRGREGLVRLYAIERAGTAPRTAIANAGVHRADSLP